MSRAEHRRQMKADQKKKKCYTFSLEAIELIKRQAVNDEIPDIFVIMNAIACLTLHDQCGWSKKRLARFVDANILKFQCWEEDSGKLARGERFDLETMINILKEETKFDILVPLVQRGMVG